MKILETQRLVLRTWQAKDLEPMAAINQDPKVMEFFPGLQDLKATSDLIKKITDHYEQNGYTLYVVELKENHVFIGFVGLLRTDFDAHFTPTTEIGWRLGSAYWGQGYATEAAKAVLHYAFTKLGLEEVASFTVVDNTRSQRVMEKIGLHHDPADDFNHPKLDENSPLRQHVLYRLKKDGYFKQ